MKTFLIILGVLVIGASAVAVAMSGKSEDKVYLWRYKMTVEVETPEGVKTGSAVREVNFTFKPRPSYRPHPYHVSYKEKGEAVIIDLGQRGILFATMPSGSHVDVVRAIGGPSPRTIEGSEYYKSLKDKKASLFPENYPWLVTFTNLSEPMSVKLVKGGEFDVAQQKNIPVDNFEQIFGEGVKIKDITVEIMDEPVVWQIEKILPWLKGLKANIDGSFGTSSNELSNVLHLGDFKRGE